MINISKLNHSKENGIIKEVKIEVDEFIICYYYRFFYTVCQNYGYFRHAVRYLEMQKIDEYFTMDITF